MPECRRQDFPCDRVLQRCDFCPALGQGQSPKLPHAVSVCAARASGAPCRQLYNRHLTARRRFADEAWLPNAAGYHARLVLCRALVPAVTPSPCGTRVGRPHDLHVPAPAAGGPFAACHYIASRSCLIALLSAAVTLACVAPLASSALATRVSMPPRTSSLCAITAPVWPWRYSRALACWYSSRLQGSVYQTMCRPPRCRLRPYAQLAGCASRMSISPRFQACACASPSRSANLRLLWRVFSRRRILPSQSENRRTRAISARSARRSARPARPAWPH